MARQKTDEVTAELESTRTELLVAKESAEAHLRDAEAHAASSATGRAEVEAALKEAQAAQVALTKERDAAIDARDRAVEQVAAERASANQMAQVIREQPICDKPREELQDVLGKAEIAADKRAGEVMPLEASVQKLAGLVKNAGEAAVDVKHEEHMLAVMLAAQYARHGAVASDRQQNEELRKAALDLVKHATQRTAYDTLAAQRASARSHDLMAQSAKKGLDVDEELEGQVVIATQTKVAAGKALKTAEQEQEQLIEAVAKRATAARGTGGGTADEGDVATAQQAIRVAIQQVVHTAVRELRKVEERMALSRELAERQTQASSRPSSPQKSDHEVAEKKKRITRMTSTVLTSKMGASASGAAFGDSGEWDRAEKAWQAASDAANEAIATAQRQLSQQQQLLSIAREELAVARKTAAEEQVEETFDPELDDATEEARSELQFIESTIRDSLERAQGARRELSAASTRSRQSRRERGGTAAGSAANDQKHTESEKCQVQLDQVQRQLEKISRDLGSSDGQWSIEDWLMSLQVRLRSGGHEQKITVLGIIANALQARRPADRSAFEYAKSLEDVEGLLLASDLTRVLAHAIEDGVASLKAQKAATAQQLSDKFKNEEGAFSFSFGGLDTFFNGLEGLVGTPNASLRVYMQMDHCGMLDSCEWFAVKNVGDVEFVGHKTTDKWGKEYPATMSLIEWYMVVDPSDEGKNAINEQLQAKDRKPIRNWPIEHDDVNRERKPNPTTAVRRKEPLATFLREATLRKIDKQLLGLRTDPLREEEVIGARLYTGPMYVKYNTVLRAAGENAPAQLKKEAGILCMRNKYTTTLHIINSAVLKLGKLTKAGTVYRGLSGGTLPEEFWLANDYGVSGGCEYAFMSTTLDREVAFSYAGSKVATILEIRMGMVDRGADVSWLSQYPGEKEILFAPLTGLEVVGKRVVGEVIVVEVRLNVNLMALTIEQVIAKMQRSHIQMLDTMIDRQKQDLTEEEVGPLLSLKDRAEARGGEWFNSPDKFELATNQAMEAQRAIVIEGVKNSRLRGIDASQLRSAANFAAKSDKPMLALQLLIKAAEQSTAKTADSVRWLASASHTLAESGHLARNAGNSPIGLRTLAPLPTTGTFFVELTLDREDRATEEPLEAGYLVGLVHLPSVDEETIESAGGLAELKAGLWGVEDSGGILHRGAGPVKDGAKSVARGSSGPVFRDCDRVGLLIDMNARRMALFVNDQPIRGLVWQGLPVDGLHVVATLQHGNSLARIREGRARGWPSDWTDEEPVEHMPADAPAAIADASVASELVAEKARSACEASAHDALGSGLKFEVDGTFMSGDDSMRLFDAGLEGILRGRLPDPEDPEKAMRAEHTSASDSSLWFNGTKLHLLATNEVHATTPFIEWFFVEGSKSHSEIGYKQFVYAKPNIDWWPLISHSSHGVVEPKHDGQHLLQWPMEAAQEAAETSATDVQRMPMKREELKKRYEERFGLTASKDPSSRLMDCELLAARLYTGPMVRADLLSCGSPASAPQSIPTCAVPYHV